MCLWICFRKASLDHVEMNIFHAMIVMSEDWKGPLTDRLEQRPKNWDDWAHTEAYTHEELSAN